MRAKFYRNSGNASKVRLTVRRNSFHFILFLNIMAGLSINELAELPAVDASFWFRHDELIRKSQDELVGINDWTKNPMSALPAWMVLVSKKVSVE